MDKKCLLTFFSVPLFFFRTTYTSGAYAFTLYLLGEQPKEAKNTLLNVEIELNPDFMAISGKGKFVDFNKFSAYCIR